MGPSRAARAVRVRTKVVAMSIRAGRSQAGDRTPFTGGPGLGASANTSVRPAATMKTAASGARLTWVRAAVQAANASVAPPKQYGQPTRSAAHAYTMAETACDSKPSRI